MAKNKRIISILGLDDSFIGMFASYCHLLKSQLTERWILNRVDEQSDIVIVGVKFTGSLDENTRVKILVGHDYEFNNTQEKKTDCEKTYKIAYPISSSQIVEVLNTISAIKVKKSFIAGKKMFALKNIFSKFILKKASEDKPKNNPISNANKNKSQKLADKLLKMRYSEKTKDLKVVFLGRPGSGKTTAITSASTNNVLTSEVSATDSVGLLKNQTTIGIDYGECEFDNGNKLRLYGTPGQVRYDYVQIQTVAMADIYVILVDLSSVAPFAEFMHYKKIIESAGNDKALRLVAFTHYDLKEHNMSVLSNEIRKNCQGGILTVKIDTRQKDEVRFMLEKASEMKLGSIPSHQYYAENGLFLRNINA